MKTAVINSDKKDELMSKGADGESRMKIGKGAEAVDKTDDAGAPKTDATKSDATKSDATKTDATKTDATKTDANAKKRLLEDAK